MSKSLRWIVFGGLALAGVAVLIFLPGRQGTKRGEEAAQVVGPLIRAAILSPFPGASAPGDHPMAQPLRVLRACWLSEGIL